MDRVTCPRAKSEMPVSSFVQLAPSSIETNYLMFSPPQRIPSSRKENIPPQIKNSTTFRKLLNENVPLSVNKASSREPKTTQVKKESTHAIAKLILSAKKRTVEKTVTLMDTENILAEHANPFINSAVFCDQRWFDEREKEIIHWLNVLLTPPEQLNSSDELPKVDVADLLKSCNSELSLAPSRETVSSRYLVNHRLDSVRRKACAMFRLPCVEEVLSKVIVQIDNEILRVRKDKKIVRDIGFNTTAVELLLCYNPLWLRIGLETITGRTIPLESNSDIVGLIGFIARNILSDPDLVEQYACPGRTDKFKKGFVNATKKHILKKCLLLVFFLDFAKENKLIFHNPGLFCKNAKYKGSHDLLLAFAREILPAVHDITELLRELGYIVKHKQTYLDEFNYAVRHLECDLQDGVRLTKVTEIILQESLSKSLCTPAISKHQKEFNVKLALTALSKAGHVEGDITPEDIVEGHREKTMSLLWQIIYKFQLSRFLCAANTIQNWYRSLHIRISRRKVIEDRASIMIQKHWRGNIARQQYKTGFVETLKPQCPATSPGPAMVSPGASMTTSMGGGGGAGGSVEERLTQLPMQQEMEGLRAEVGDLNEKLETLREEHFRARLVEIQNEQILSRVENSSLKAALENEKKRSAVLENKVIELQNFISELQRDVGDRENNIKTLSQETGFVETLKPQCPATSPGPAMVSPGASMTTSMGGGGGAGGSVEERLTQLPMQQEMEGLRAEVGDLNEKLETLREEHFRARLVEIQNEQILSRVENSSLKAALENEKKRSAVLENKVIELQNFISELQRDVGDRENNIKTLSQETGFVETLKPQCPATSPGPAMVSPGASMTTSMGGGGGAGGSVEERLTQLPMQQEMEGLRAEVGDLNEKLETLRAKRQQDEEKLKEHDKLRMQLEQMAELNTRLMESQAALQRDLQRAKQEAREAIDARERHADEMADLVAERVEMATLDKEMAEEKAKTLQLELEQVRERLEEVTLDHENLKAELSERAGGPPSADGSAPSSFELKQLQQQIASLSETLVRYEREIAEWKKKYDEMESLIAPFIEQMETFQTECETLQAEKGEVQESMREVSLQYAASFGHQNTKQKIQYMVKLKEHNMELKETVCNLKKTIKKLRKDGTNAGTNLV